MTLDTFIKEQLPGYTKGDFTIPFPVRQKNFEANCVITDYGQIEDKIFLLHEGLIQVATLNDDEERILEFVFPVKFFSAYTSFLQQQPSDVQLLTLAPCSVSIIDRENLLQANQTSFLSNHLSLHIAQQLFLSRARREKDFITLSAEERYKILLEKHPEVVKHIPGNRIAKYLGIQAESLSRIRKSIIP